MKRHFISILAAFLCLGLLPASAATLKDLRRQAPAYSARLDIPILLPQAERAPVLRLRAGQLVPTLAEPAGASFARANPGAYGAAYNDPVWQNYGQPDMRYNLPKGQSFAWQKVSPPWDLSRAYPENNPLRLGEALDFARGHLARATDGRIQIDLFSLSVVNSGQRGRATPMGYDILPPYGQGSYELGLRQVIGGWMVMDSVNSYLANSYRGERPESLFRESQVRVASPSSYFIGISFLETEAVLAEDIPLCPLDQVTAAYERLSISGQIRRMSELRLGYVLFWEEARQDACIAFPCWLLKAEYLENPRQKPSAAFAGLPVEASPHYAQLLVNARTGELIGPGIAREQDAMAPEWGK